jgi:hypothetical protein
LKSEPFQGECMPYQAISNLTPGTIPSWAWRQRRD